MKVITNTPLIEQRAKWGRRIAPLTMFLLIGGLITNFLSINQPEYFRLTLILLTLGFFCAIISSHLVSHWVKEPRADQTLSTLLKKFNNNYLLFNYTAPASHVLVAPNSLYVIMVKDTDGQVTINGRKISRKFTLRRLLRFLFDEGLSAPIAETEKQCNKLHKYLLKHIPEEELPEINPLLLFGNKDVELTINDPAIPILTTKEFKSYVREEGKKRNISTTQRNQLAELLDLQ